MHTEPFFSGHATDSADEAEVQVLEAPEWESQEPAKAFTIILGGEADEEEIGSLQGYFSPWWKTLLFYAVALLTCGISLLACKWSPKIYIALRLKKCALSAAQCVRITLVDGRTDLERVEELEPPGPQYDSQPQLAAEEEAEGRPLADGLLDWQAAPRFKLLEYRCQRYFYVESLGTFVPVPGCPKGFNEQLKRTATALSGSAAQAAALVEDTESDLQERQLRYGTNEMRIPVKSLARLIYEEMWHPFYCFQYASILIWIFGDQYYSYSVCIFVITWFSIISSALEAHSNMKRLADIAYFSCDVEVLRNGQLQTVPSPALVPGDVVVVGTGTLPCDMVLLRGEAIVDENMLTGESVPVRKVCYSPVADGLAYSPDKNSSCTLYGGTMVAQARAPRGQRALAMVCRTRFYSSKGQLLRSILFPRQHEEAFISDSLKFIAFMLAGCIGLYIWAAVVLAQAGATPSRIIVRFFDMITIAVPPALPACLTIATVFSIGRLRKRDVYVTGPDRITMAGQLDVIAFDKTGTLTEQGLDLLGVVPIVNGQSFNMVNQVSLLPLSITELLASCHGLAKMGDTLVGDPLDQKLFLATHWELIDERNASMEAAVGSRPDPVLGLGLDASATAGEALAAQADATGQSAVHSYVRPPGAANAYAIIKRFEFNAALQRNLVVVRAPPAPLKPALGDTTAVVTAAAAGALDGMNGQQQEHSAGGSTDLLGPRSTGGGGGGDVDGSSQDVVVYVKGSPEAVRSLVVPDSVPPEFDELLSDLTREGLRVLALAQGNASHVPLDVLLHWTQSETEASIPLRMVGLAVMANPLRPDTTDIINRLQHASIRTLMVTGDHLRTAISVAHKCHILPDQKPILLVDGTDAPGGTSGSAASLAQLAAQPDAASRFGSEPPSVGFASPASSSVGPLAAQATSTSSAGSAAGVRLSVLNVDGSVEHVHAPAGALARVMVGELEAAVTGKGFTRLCEAMDPEVLLPLLRRASVWARMSPDNKRDLIELLGSGLGGGGMPPAQQPAAASSRGKGQPGASPHGTPRSNGLALPVSSSPLRLSSSGAPLSANATANGNGNGIPPVDSSAGSVGKVAAGVLDSSISAELPPPLCLGLHVGFCGDGANDCGALKAAHVGVSLCEAEASVAAPMTSKTQSIASMVTVVAEGRCTLMCTYQIFQFIIGYALVQAFETNLMYTYSINIGNYQYLIEDLFFTTVLAALMGFTRPRNKLSRSKPLQRVMSAPLLISTLMQLAVVIVFQKLALVMLAMQPGYQRFKGDKDLRDVVAPENTVTYVVALSQFIILALVFNKGMPHRSPLWTNMWLVLALLAQTGFMFFTLFASNNEFNTDVQQLVDKDVLDMTFRAKLLGLVVANGITAVVCEYISIGIVKLCTWWCAPRTK